MFWSPASDPPRSLDSLGFARWLRDGPRAGDVGDAMNDENLGKLAGRLGQELDVDGLPDPDNGREFIRAALREAHALGREEQRKKDAEACRNERVDADATGDATDEAYNRACDDCAKAIEEGDRVTGGKREGAGE